MGKGIAVLAAAAALGAGALAGCGGNEDKDYVDRLNDAQKAFATEVQRIAVSSSDVTRLPGTLTSIAAQLDELVAELRGIDAPAEVASQHRRLEQAMRDYGAALRDQAGKLRSRDRGSVTSAGNALSRATARAGAQFDGAVREINEELKN